MYCALDPKNSQQFGENLCDNQPTLCVCVCVCVWCVCVCVCVCGGCVVYLAKGLRSRVQALRQFSIWFSICPAPPVHTAVAFAGVQIQGLFS